MISEALFAYLVPWHSGQSMSTSGRNCTSRLIEPVPSQTGQRSDPVLYEKSPALSPLSFASFVFANIFLSSSCTPA